jgi:hypothetical protein
MGNYKFPQKGPRPGTQRHENGQLERLKQAMGENVKQEMTCGILTVRGINVALYTEARAQAIREGKNIGAWINEAIREKLAKK